MKKALINLFLFLLISTVGYSQQGHLTISSGDRLTLSNCIATSDNGFVGVGSNVRGSGFNSGFIVKLDSNLAQKWSFKVEFQGVNTSEHVFTVAETSDGGYVFAASNYVGSTHYTIQIFKTDSLGKLLWDKEIDPGLNRQSLHKIISDDKGHIYLMGYTAKWPQVAHTQGFLYKLDNLGNVIFTNTYYNANTTSIVDLQFGNNNEIFAAAYGGQGGSLSHQLIKMDSVGNVLWTKEYFSSNNAGANNVFRVDPAHFIIAGNSWDAPGGVLSVSILKVDTAGNLIWTKLITQTGENFYAKNAFQMDNGNIAIAAHKHIPNNTGPKFLCVDTSGAIIWSKTSQVGRANVFDVYQTQAGNLMFSGWMDAPSSSKQDMLLIETDRNGNALDTCLQNTSMTVHNAFFTQRNIITTRVARLPFSTKSITLSPFLLSTNKPCVIPAPVARFDTDSVICKGDCITLLDRSQSAINYSWTAAGAIPSFSIQKQPNFCYPDTGSFTIQLIVQNSVGADSTSFQIKVRDQSSAAGTITSCVGDSLQIGGNWYFADTLVSDTLINIYNCDSITELSLHFHPKELNSESRTICFGDSTYFNNRWIKARGRYSYVRQSINGCDSIISLDLEFFTDPSTTEQRQLCQGDSSFFDGTWLKQAGTYQKTYRSQFGCDSVQTLMLAVQSIDTLLGKVGDLLFANEDSASYQWIFCANDSLLVGETGKSYLPAADGSYGVIISRNGCTDTTDCFAFKKPIPERPIRIYPTIILDRILNVDLGKVVGQADVQIYNSLGQIVYENVVSDLSFIELNLPLASAVYYLAITLKDEKTQTFKFVMN